MNTSTCLHLYPCDGKATDRIAASLPPLPEPVRPYRGSGTPDPGIQATSQHSVMHQQRPDDPSWETTLLGTDQRRTVLYKRAAQDQADLVYTPYGHSQDTGGVTGGLGFNGERREAVTGHYLLGAGYRAFNPVLMRFNSPDNLSPFGEGGLNPYAYCVGDPVNFVDPTGHLPNWAMMAIGIVGGIALGVVSGGVGTLMTGSMAASTAATVGNASMVLGVGLEIGAVGTGVAAEVVGGEEGALLGKISMGLGFAAGAVGGFGVRLRLQNPREVLAFRIKKFSLTNQQGEKEIFKSFRLDYDSRSGAPALQARPKVASAGKAIKGGVYRPTQREKYVIDFNLNRDPAKEAAQNLRDFELKRMRRRGDEDEIKGRAF